MPRRSSPLWASYGPYRPSPDSERARPAVAPTAAEPCPWSLSTTHFTHLSAVRRPSRPYFRAPRLGLTIGRGSGAVKTEIRWPAAISGSEMMISASALMPHELCAHRDTDAHEPAGPTLFVGTFVGTSALQAADGGARCPVPGARCPRAPRNPSPGRRRVTAIAGNREPGHQLDGGGRWLRSRL